MWIIITPSLLLTLYLMHPCISFVLLLKDLDISVTLTWFLYGGDDNFIDIKKY